MKRKSACFVVISLTLLALGLSSCAEQEESSAQEGSSTQEGGGADGPPDSSPVRPNLGPGGAGINTNW